MRKPSDARLADEVGAVLERERGVVDRRRVQLRLAEGEAQLREVRDLVGLPAGRLEQDRGADTPVDVAQRSLGVGVERLAVRLLAGDVGVDRRDQAATRRAGPAPRCGSPAPPAVPSRA